MPSAERPESYDAIRQRLPKQPGTRWPALSDELIDALVTLIAKPMTTASALALMRVRAGDYEQWKRLGQVDLDEGRDSLPSRLVSDLAAAVGANNAALEERILNSDDDRVALEARARISPESWEKGRRNTADEIRADYAGMTHVEVMGEVARMMSVEDAPSVAAALRAETAAALADELARRLHPASTPSTAVPSEPSEVPAAKPAKPAGS